MRHRRIMQRRREALFGTEYLDFMGEQDFTTVTTNQLLASLGEAPPTYQQSEVIEQRLRQAEDSDEEAPPPLPPRNTSTQDHHQLESEPSEQVTGAEEADVGERGEEDKEERPIEPSTTDSEEEETHSEKDGDSMALIGWYTINICKYYADWVLCNSLTAICNPYLLPCITCTSILN